MVLNQCPGEGPKAPSSQLTRRVSKGSPKALRKDSGRCLGCPKDAEKKSQPFGATKNGPKKESDSWLWTSEWQLFVLGSLLEANGQALRGGSSAEGDLTSVALGGQNGFVL